MIGSQVPTLLRLPSAMVNCQSASVDERQYRTARRGQHLIASSGHHVLAESGSVVLATAGARVIALNGSKVTSLGHANVEEHNGSLVVRVVDSHQTDGVPPITEHERQAIRNENAASIVGENPLQASPLVFRLDSLVVEAFTSDLLLQLRYQFMSAASSKQVRPVIELAKFFPRFEIKFRDKDSSSSTTLRQHRKWHTRRRNSMSQILRSIKPNYIRNAS